MATVNAPFDKYKIWYYSSYPLNAYYDCLIYCYQGTTYVGRIEFHKMSEPDANLKSRIDSGQPSVVYRIDRFADVYQILLEDKPLYLFVNDANGIGMVATADYEDVGQEE